MARSVFFARRLVQLYAGLWLYGLSAALQVRASLGLDPWDVLHQGVSRRSGLSIGLISIIVGAAVLLLWIPLRQRPGVGTVSNVVVVGLSLNAGLAMLPPSPPMAWRIAELVGGVVLCGVATGMYIGSNFGAGPRDGLMTGLARRTGGSIRLVRTGIEATVLVVGWLLGGQVGVGTVLFAVTIGPLAQLFLPVFAMGPTPARRPRGPARWRSARRPSRTPGARRRTPAADLPATPCSPAPRPGG